MRCAIEFLVSVVEPGPNRSLWKNSLLFSICACHPCAWGLANLLLLLQLQLQLQLQLLLVLAPEGRLYTKLRAHTFETAVGPKP